MIKLSIVLPIFNGLDYTKVCLKSLYSLIDFKTNDITFSIVIVDDGSTDGSAKWIKVNYPQVHLLSGNGRLWWSGGINMAIQYAIEQLNSDYFLWWNNDIEAEEMYFQNLLQIIKNNDTNTIIGSKIYLASQKNIIWSMGGFFNPVSGRKSMKGSNIPDNENLQNEIEADWLPGMGTVTHQSIYEKIGMLDEENFPQYHGDSDFTLRAKLNGCKIVVYPSLKIYNDNTHSGLTHQESLTGLLKSLFSIKSNYYIKKDLKFYNRYSRSYRAYFVLFSKYYKYIGGFLKWKFLGVFGVKK